MSARRQLSCSAHGATDFLAGTATMLAPAALGFGPAGIVVCFALGSLLVGVALALSAPPGPTMARHRELDSALLIAAAVSALTLAFAGERAAALFLALLVAVQSVLSLTTRYTSST